MEKTISFFFIYLLVQACVPVNQYQVSEMHGFFYEGNRVFPGKLTSGGIFNNSLLFKTNRLLVFYCFWKFLWGDKAFMEREKVAMGESPSFLQLGKTLGITKISTIIILIIFSNL